MKTRIFTYTLAGAMVFAATSASAIDFTLGASGGVVHGTWKSTTSTNLANPTATGDGDAGAGIQQNGGAVSALATNFNVETDKTFTATDPLGEVALGMRFAPNMRAELAVSGFQMKESYSQITANTDPAANTNVVKTLTTSAIVTREPLVSDFVNVPVRTKTRNYAAMLNAYYEFGGNDMFSPYVSLGIGAERNKLSTTVTPPAYTHRDATSGADATAADNAAAAASFVRRPAAKTTSKTKTGFRYSVGFGVDAKLADMANVGLSYGWHGSSGDVTASDGVADTATANPSTSTLKRKGGSHVVMVKARFEF